MGVGGEGEYEGVGGGGGAGGGGDGDAAVTGHWSPELIAPRPCPEPDATSIITYTPYWPRVALKLFDMSLALNATEYQLNLLIFPFKQPLACP